MRASSRGIIVNCDSIISNLLASEKKRGRKRKEKRERWSERGGERERGDRGLENFLGSRRELRAAATYVVTASREFYIVCGPALRETARPRACYGATAYFAYVHACYRVFRRGHFRRNIVRSP